MLTRVRDWLVDLGWWRLLVAVVVILLLVRSLQSPSTLPTGVPAPAFRLAAVEDGQQHALEDYRGRYVLLEAFTSWCGVCRKQAAELNAFHEEQEGKVEVLSVSFDDDARDGLAAARGWGLAHPVLAADGAFQRAYAVGAFPTFFLIGPDGVLLRSQAGYRSASQLRSWVDAGGN